MTLIRIQAVALTGLRAVVPNKCVDQFVDPLPHPRRRGHLNRSPRLVTARSGPASSSSATAFYKDSGSSADKAACMPVMA